MARPRDLDLCTRPGGEHEYVAIGMWGPYPVEDCRHCHVGRLLDAPGMPAAYDTFTEALRQHEEKEGWCSRCRRERHKCLDQGYWCLPEERQPCDRPQCACDCWRHAVCDHPSEQGPVPA